MSLSMIPKQWGLCFSTKSLISVNLDASKLSSPTSPFLQFHSANLYPSRLMLPVSAWQRAFVVCIEWDQEKDMAAVGNTVKTISVGVVFFFYLFNSINASFI